MGDNIINIATRKRRSSILKTQKSRAPLSDIELSSPTSSEITSKSRRVSFSRKKDVAEFVADEATTAWKNFYEEQNNHTLEISENEPVPPGFKKPSKAAEILMYQRNPIIQHDISNFQDLNISQRVNIIENQKEKTRVAFKDGHEMSILKTKHSMPFSNSIGGYFGMNRTGRYDNDVPLVGDPSDNHIDASNIFRQLQEIGIYQGSEACNRNDEVSDEDMLKRMAHDFKIDFNQSKTLDMSDMSITEPVQAPVKHDIINSRNRFISSTLSAIDKENIAIKPSKKIEMSGYKQDKVLVYDGEKIKYEDVINDMINELGTPRPQNVASHDTFLTCSDESLVKTRSSSSDCKIESKSELVPENAPQPISQDSIRTVFSENIAVSRVIPSADSFKIIPRINDSETTTTDSETYNRQPSIPERKSSETIVFDEQEVIMTQTILQKLIEAKQANKTIVFSKHPDRFFDNHNSDTKVNQHINEFQRTESCNKLNNKNTFDKLVIETETQGLKTEVENVPSVNTEPSQLDNKTIYFDTDQQSISMTQIVSKNTFQEIEVVDDTQKTMFFNEQAANLSMTQALPQNILQEKAKENTVYYDNEELDMSEVVPNKIVDHHSEAVVEESHEVNKENIEVNRESQDQIKEGLDSNKVGAEKVPPKTSQDIQDSISDYVDLTTTSESNQCSNKPSIVEVNGTNYFKDHKRELSPTRAFTNLHSLSQRTLVFSNGNNSESQFKFATSNIDNISQQNLDTISQRTFNFAGKNSDMSMTQPVTQNILSQINDSQKTICFGNDSADISMTKAVPQSIFKNQQNNDKTSEGFVDMSFTKAIPQNIFLQNLNTNSQATPYFNNNAGQPISNVIPTKDIREVINCTDLMKHSRESSNETIVQTQNQEEPLQHITKNKESGKLSPDRTFTQTLTEQIKLKVQQKHKEYQESVFRQYIKSDSVERNDSVSSNDELVMDKISENSVITDYHHSMKAFIAANGKSPLTFNELIELNKIKRMNEASQRAFHLSGKSEKPNHDHSQNNEKPLVAPKPCFGNLVPNHFNQSSTQSYNSDHSQSTTIPRSTVDPKTPVSYTSSEYSDTDSQQHSSKEMAKLAFLKTLADAQTSKTKHLNTTRTRSPHKIVGPNYEFKGYDQKNHPDVIQKLKLISNDQYENNEVQDQTCFSTQIDNNISSMPPKPPPPFQSFLEYQNVASNPRKSTARPAPPPKPLSPPKILKFETKKKASFCLKKSGGVKVIDNKSLFDQIQEKLAAFKKKASEEDDDDHTISENSDYVSKDATKCSSPVTSSRDKPPRPLSPKLPHGFSNARKDDRSLVYTSAKALASVIKGTPEKAYEKELKNVLDNALANVNAQIDNKSVDPAPTDVLKKAPHSPKNISSNVSSVCSKKSTKRGKDEATEPKKIPSLINVQRKTVKDLRKIFGDAHLTENDEVEENTIEELTEQVTPCESYATTLIPTSTPYSGALTTETQTMGETDESMFQTASLAIKSIPIDDPESECRTDKDNSEIQNSEVIILTKVNEMTSTTSGTSGVDDVQILVNDGEGPGTRWHKSGTKHTVTSALNLHNQDTDQPTTSHSNISSDESSQSVEEYISQNLPKTSQKYNTNYKNKGGEKHYGQVSTVATAKVQPSISLKAEIEKYIEVTKNQAIESNKKTSPKKSPKKGPVKDQLVSDVMQSVNSSKKKSIKLTDTSESMESDSPNQTRQSAGKNRTYVIEAKDEPGRILAINSISGISTVDEAIRSALDHMKRQGSIEFVKIKNNSPSKSSPKIVTRVKNSKNTSDSVTPSDSVNSDTRSLSPGRKVRFESEKADPNKSSWPKTDDCENIENTSQNVLNVTNDSDETLCSPKSQVKILYLGADDLCDGNKNSPTTVLNASVKVRSLAKAEKPIDSDKEEQCHELRKAVEVLRKEDHKQKSKPIQFKQPEAAKVIRVSDVDLKEDIVTEIDALPFIGKKLWRQRQNVRKKLAVSPIPRNRMPSAPIPKGKRPQSAPIPKRKTPHSAPIPKRKTSQSAPIPKRKTSESADEKRTKLKKTNTNRKSVSLTKKKSNKPQKKIPSKSYLFDEVVSLCSNSPKNYLNSSREFLKHLVARENQVDCSDIFEKRKCNSEHYCMKYREKEVKSKKMPKIIKSSLHIHKSSFKGGSSPKKKVQIVLPSG